YRRQDTARADGVSPDVGGPQRHGAAAAIIAWWTHDVQRTAPGVSEAQSADWHLPYRAHAQADVYDPVFACWHEPATPASAGWLGRYDYAETLRPARRYRPNRSPPTAQPRGQVVTLWKISTRCNAHVTPGSCNFDRSCQSQGNIYVTLKTPSIVAPPET